MNRVNIFDSISEEDFFEHNAADAVQCLIDDFDSYLDGSVDPDDDSHQCSRDNAILIQDTLAQVRELGEAIENGDPQTIANIWLMLKPNIELRDETINPSVRN